VLPARVGYSLQQGAVTVDAHLGVGLPERAYLDTALPACVVSPQLVQEKGWARGGEVTIAGPLGLLDATALRSSGARLGPYAVENLPFVSADMAARLTGAERADMPRLWLGLAALSPCAVTLDPGSSTITFARPETAPPRGSHVIPMDISRGRIEVQARINNAAMRSWIVSTAISGTLLPPEGLGAAAQEAGPPREVRSPSGGKARIAEVEVKELAIGAAKISGVRAVAVVGGEWTPTGVVGTDVLLRHQVYINCSRRQIALAPRQEGREPERQPGPVRPKRQAATGPRGPG
jgi:hypothetical protein